PPRRRNCLRRPGSRPSRRKPCLISRRRESPADRGWKIEDRASSAECGSLFFRIPHSHSTSSLLVFDPLSILILDPQASILNPHSRSSILGPSPSTSEFSQIRTKFNSIKC